MSALTPWTDSAPITVGSFDAWPELHGAWYADPFDQADLRWWDDTKWTEAVKPADESAPSGVGRRRALRIPARLLVALARL